MTTKTHTQIPSKSTPKIWTIFFLPLLPDFKMKVHGIGLLKYWLSQNLRYSFFFKELTIPWVDVAYRKWMFNITVLLWFERNPKNFLVNDHCLTRITMKNISIGTERLHLLTNYNTMWSCFILIFRLNLLEEYKKRKNISASNNPGNGYWPTIWMTKTSHRQQMTRKTIFTINPHLIVICRGLIAAHIIQFSSQYVGMLKSPQPKSLPRIWPNITFLEEFLRPFL